MMVTATFAACADSPQTIVGRVATSSYPEPVTRVVAIGNDGTFYAPVAADGSFDLAVPAGDRYRLEMRSGIRGSQVVFPRTTERIDTSFFVVESGAAFDLGGVHYREDTQTSVPDHSPDDALNGDTGDKGEQDTGTGGGHETGTGGGQDTGTGGGGH
jgi:hypothetical protein